MNSRRGTKGDKHGKEDYWFFIYLIFTKLIVNFYYFQIGRWDIQLANNKIIKLPQNNIEDAIKKSIELLEREDFENYNIIDLRVGGKIIVE